MKTTTDKMSAPPESETLCCEIRDSCLGLVLIATSARGVCAILFGDDRAVLQKEFQRRFPKATLASPTKASQSLTASVLALVDERTVETPPLDLRGTDFQKRIWWALLEIPAGSTISYKELARRAGAPAAVRAVAGACAANPLAILVPCHRVVRHDGGLSGYRWGVGRKRTLLAREGVLVGGAK
jgi:AraC family transcriptional regulator of adaptative response/methylated-DNA-[protein]-cysteine methyltransferase